MQKKLRKTYNEIMSSVHLVENPDGVYRYPLSGIARRLGCSVKEILEHEFQPLEHDVLEIYKGKDDEIFMHQKDTTLLLMRMPEYLIKNKQVKPLIIRFTMLSVKVLLNTIDEQQAQLN